MSKKYDSIKLNYYQGRRKYATTITDDQEGQKKLTELVASGLFVSRGQARDTVKQNYTTLLFFLNRVYASLDFFMSNLMTDLFYYEGQGAVKFFKLLQKPNATESDFDDLGLI